MDIISHYHRKTLYTHLIGLVAVVTVVGLVAAVMSQYSFGGRVSITANGGITYYVSPSGNDNNVGDVQHPFLTPKKATGIAVAGDTIVLKDGDYNLAATLKFSNSGSSGSPIVLKAEHQGKATLIGPSAAGFYGIYIDKNYIVIDGIEQKEAGESGIKPSGTNVTIMNSIIHGNGVPYFGGPHLHNGQGIGASSPSAQFFRIENNDIFGNFEHGIYISGSDDTTITGNKIHDNGYFDLQFNDDGGIDGSLRATVIDNTIYSTTHPSESGGMNLITLRSSIVQNNLIYELGKGISLSGTNGKNGYIAADNNTFTYNTFVSAGYGTVTVTKAQATGNKFYNNIIVHTPSGLSGQYPFVFDAGGLAEADHNVVWNAGGSNIGQLPDGTKYNFGQWQTNMHLDVNSKNLDPHFANQGASDYHLNGDSPAIGLASNTYTTSSDLDGNIRPNASSYDSGAYEYVGSGGGGTTTADLGITLSIDNVKPKEGDTSTLTVTVKNNGPDTATSVVAKDVLPAGLTFVSASGGTYDQASGIWTIGSLNNGASTTLILKATVNSGTNGNTITDSASVTESSTISDSNSANNSASLSLIVTNVADLGIAKSLDDTKPRVGDTVAFTIKVTNFGPSAAESVVVKDIFPTDLTFVSSSNGTYNKSTGDWTIGSLNNGASTNLILKGTVNSGTLGKTIPNSATSSEAGNIFNGSGNDSSSVSLTVAETPCTSNCGGGSTEPVPSNDISVPGSGPIASSGDGPGSPDNTSNGSNNSGNSTGSTPKNSSGSGSGGNKSTAAVQKKAKRVVDLVHSYVRVSGKNVIANDTDSYTITIGLADATGSSIIDQKPHIILGGGDTNLKDTALKGSEWVAHVASKNPGVRTADISAGGVALGKVTFEFAAKAGSNTASTPAPTIDTPPIPIPDDPALPISAPPIEGSWWQRTRASVSQFLQYLGQGLLEYYTRVANHN